MYNYDNSHDANLYLRDTLVKYEGELVQVVHVGDDMMVRIVNSRGYDSTVDMSSLDLSPIKLGYVFNSRTNTSLYIEREPRRQWRQGVYSGVCRIKGGGGRPNISVSSPIAKRLSKGRYPVIHRAYRLAIKKRTEIPFTSVFTVDYLSQVRHKTKVIGCWADKRIDVLRSFSYLEDIIEEYMYEHYGRNI